MRNIALRVAYDGTDFIGSQLQTMGRSIQGALEEAWEELTQERRRFTLAGRTDAGVHARGQVANVRTETHHNLKTIKRAVNAHLPDDVAVLEVAEVDNQFHARHSALRRSYRYLIDNGSVPLPMLRHQAVFVEKALDHELIDTALQTLKGRHDFAAFAAASEEQRSTVRICYDIHCSPMEVFGQPCIAIDITANSFLHHMVRNIVGTALLVGVGKLTPVGFEQILQGRNRRAAGKTAAAHGLTLEHVVYPPEQLRWGGDKFSNLA